MNGFRSWFRFIRLISFPLVVDGRYSGSSVLLSDAFVCSLVFYPSFSRERSTLAIPVLRSVSFGCLVTFSVLLSSQLDSLRGRFTVSLGNYKYSALSGTSSGIWFPLWSVVVPATSCFPELAPGGLSSAMFRVTCGLSMPSYGTAVGVVYSPLIALYAVRF